MAADSQATYAVTATFAGHTGGVTSLEYAPSGAVLASASADGTVRLWRSDGSSSGGGGGAAAAPLAVLRHSEQGLSQAAWAPSGGHLVSASDDTTLRVWDAATVRVARGLATRGRHAPSLCLPAPAHPLPLPLCLQAQPCVTLRGHDSLVSCCAWSARGSLVASGSWDESVRLWDPRAGTRPARALAAHSDPVTAVAFSPDGSMLATGSFDGLARLWDVGTGALLRTVQYDGTPPVGGLCWAPNGAYLLVATLDGAHRLWSVASGATGSGSVPPPSTVARAYTGHAGRHLPAAPAIARAAHVGADSSGHRQAVVSGSEDGRVCVWDATTRRLVASLDMDEAGRGDNREGPDAATAASGSVSSKRMVPGSSSAVTAPSSQPPWSSTRCGSIVAVTAHPVHGAAVIAAGESAGAHSVRVWAATDAGGHSSELSSG
jgi:COMPASS component SWD3